MKFEIFISRMAEKDLKNLELKMKKRIYSAIDKLQEVARPVGSLKLTNREGYRIRIGDYRLLYEVSDLDRKIIIHRCRHRREVYE